MASAARTPKLSLPQWTAAEKPERTDFNAAFLAIDNAVGPATINPIETNLNNYTATGKYTFGNPASYTNIPTTNDVGVLVVDNCGAYIMQTYRTQSTVYTRFWGPSSWSPWQGFSTTSVATMLYDGGAITDLDIPSTIGFKYIHLYGHWAGGFLSGLTLPVSYLISNFARSYSILALNTLTQYAVINVKFTSASHIQVAIANSGGFAGGLHVIGSN